MKHYIVTNWGPHSPKDAFVVLCADHFILFWEMWKDIGLKVRFYRENTCFINRTHEDGTTYYFEEKENV